MISSYSSAASRTTYSFFAVVFCLIPLLVYGYVFGEVALNINYIAYDDTTVLAVIQGFDQASWAERLKILTALFAEHRLVFLRLVVLSFYYLTGNVNLVGLMLVGNLCWVGCLWIFYRVFRSLELSLWYFVPVPWLWLHIQSFENMFWGISSLCNFGVLFFGLYALYYTAFSSRPVVLSALLCALVATFTYGNGLMIWAVMALLSWMRGQRLFAMLVIATAVVVAYIYFVDFTPITQNLNWRNSRQVKEGLAGFFGFIGSIATLNAYAQDPARLYTAVLLGGVLVGGALLVFHPALPSLLRSLVGKPVTLPPGALFALGIFVFVAITAFAVVYKRIPTDEFVGMFKGRYRMYATLWLVGLYVAILAYRPRWIQASHTLRGAIVLSIFLNLGLLYANLDMAINNRRMAVVQEFNSRYNTDWLGLKMFEMSQEHFETIRAFYGSQDPLAEGWDPRVAGDSLACTGGLFQLDTLLAQDDYLVLRGSGNTYFDATLNYTDGPYVLLKSATHVYALPPNQTALPILSALKRGRYLAGGFSASTHVATIEPGQYRVYMLQRTEARNTLYCTNLTWTREKD